METLSYWLLGIIAIAIIFIIYEVRSTKPFKLTEEDAILGLQKMNKTDPKKRGLDRWDFWFRANVNEFQKYDKALEIINQYGFVSDTYFRELKNAQQNIDLQKKLISVKYNMYVADYQEKFSNLLCGYLRHWDLAPEIKDTVFNTQKLRRIKEIYKLFRN